MGDERIGFFARARADGARGELRVRGLGVLLVILALFFLAGGLLVIASDGTPVGAHHATVSVAATSCLSLAAMVLFPVGAWLLVAGAGAFAAGIFRALGVVAVVAALGADLVIGVLAVELVTMPQPAPHPGGGGFDWD
jgi:hypothetical protein